MKAVIRLRILELYTIPDFEFVQPVWMDFEDVFGRMAGDIGGMPSACQDGIHDHIFGVDPDDRQIYEDEQHVDGGIEATVTPLDKNQTFARSEAGAKHEAAQAAEETLTVDRLQRRGQGLVFIFDVDDIHITNNGADGSRPVQVGFGSSVFLFVEHIINAAQ